MYSMVSARPKDLEEPGMIFCHFHHNHHCHDDDHYDDDDDLNLTKSALTVSMKLTSLGSRALFVSPR